MMSYYLLQFTTLTSNKNWFCYSDSLSSLDCMHDFASAGLDSTQSVKGFRQLENHLAFSHHCFLTPDAVRAQEAGVEPDAVCGGVPAAGAGTELESSFQKSTVCLAIPCARFRSFSERFTAAHFSTHDL